MYMYTYIYIYIYICLQSWKKVLTQLEPKLPVWKHTVWPCMPAHLCQTPRAVGLKALLSMRFSRQEYWSGLLLPSPGDLLNWGIKPMSLVSPALAGGFFTRWGHNGVFKYHFSSTDFFSNKIQVDQYAIETYFGSVCPGPQQCSCWNLHL